MSNTKAVVRHHGIKKTMLYDDRTQTTQTNTLTTTYKKVYGYIRISDVKQEKGASREAQQEAIKKYAQQHNLTIIDWFEETRSAAKTGRLEFNAMLKNIRLGKATGFIGHKIDRTSRNLEDWNRMVKLHEQGYEIHFAHENVNLSERSGRLSADIQLIMACDYIRNLRQETIKGLYQRLKDGYYPWSAPIGYVNNGKGKLKTPHPVHAPLIKKLFELYATGEYSHRSLVPIMYDLGLRNHRGNKVGKTGIANILKTSFYTGIIQIKGQTFIGKHEPLISTTLFKKAQKLRDGKIQVRKTKHHFLFRQLLHCGHCSRRLIGELQKERVYYRCQNKGCSNSVREDVIENQILNHLATVQFTSREAELLKNLTSDFFSNKEKKQEHLELSLGMENNRLKNKLSTLTDTYLEGDIDKELFTIKKQEIQEMVVKLKEKKALLVGDKADIFKNTMNFLELAKSLVNSYNSASLDEKRKILRNVVSNFSVSDKKLCISMAFPYSELTKTGNALKCAHSRDVHRTFDVSFEKENATHKRKKWGKRELKQLLQLLVSNPEHPYE